MSDFNEIIIKYIWSKRTYLQAIKEAYEYEYKHSFKRYIGWLFIILLQFGIVAAIKKGSIGLMVLSSILVFYWYFLRWPIRKYIYSKTYDKLKLDGKEFIIKINEDGLEINSNKLEWEDIIKSVNLPNGVMLYLKKGFIYLPKENFKTKEQLEEFIKILKEHSRYLDG